MYWRLFGLGMERVAVDLSPNSSFNSGPERLVMLVMIKVKVVFTAL